MYNNIPVRPRAALLVRDFSSRSGISDSRKLGWAVLAYILWISSIARSLRLESGAKSANCLGSLRSGVRDDEKPGHVTWQLHRTIPEKVLAGVNHEPERPGVLIARAHYLTCLAVLRAGKLALDDVQAAGRSSRSLAQRKPPK